MGAAPAIKGFILGSYVYAAHVHQQGKVVLRDRENVGVRYDNGCVAVYGASWFAIFPGVIRGNVDIEPAVADPDDTSYTMATDELAAAVAEQLGGE